MIPDANRPLPRSTRTGPVRSGGFTLIELLIAIVVLGILAAIAYPQYTEFVRRSRVVEATNGMNDLRTRMEQFFQDNRRYDDGGGACGVQMPGVTPDTKFSFACVPGAAPSQSYVITANGIGPMSAFRYNITVDPTVGGVGVLRTTLSTYWGAPLPAPNNCWQVRKGGLCS